MDSKTGDIISQVIGWSYFVAWSVSFYPQVWMNFRRKSVVGLSFDYVTYNILGFTCYTAYNSAFYFSESIQEQYRRMNNGKENQVALNDVFFGIHAVVLTLIVITQVILYEKGGQRVSRICMFLVAGGILSIIVVFILACVHVVQWIWFFYYLSMVKLAITLIKYIPQVWLNYRRKSTVGWTIYNVLLDFTGGILSVIQLIFDSWRHDDWTAITGDVAKFLLGFLSMFFDVIFMVQHYILYRHAVDDAPGIVSTQPHVAKPGQYKPLKEDLPAQLLNSDASNSDSRVNSSRYQPLTSTSLDSEEKYQ